MIKFLKWKLHNLTHSEFMSFLFVGWVFMLSIIAPFTDIPIFGLIALYVIGFPMVLLVLMVIIGFVADCIIPFFRDIRNVYREYKDFPNQEADKTVNKLKGE